MRAACVVARPLIVSSVAEGRGIPAGARAHRDRCLRCHALESRVRLTQRHLASVALKDQPRVDLVDTVVGRLNETPTARRIGLWRPVAAGTAGVMVALAVLAVRRRMVAPA